jgi:(1->4)-alpha-D-glucan 1-alpha-D-glucosylmutase
MNDFREEDRPQLVDWTMRFQQVSGPVMAKGVEDTALYVFNRLVSLNEVGGHPDQFGVTPEEFHAANAERLRYWPHAQLATATHDTKRSEDVRARLNVLSEVPVEWKEALARWRQYNEPHKTLIDERPAPDSNDEYLLYQTLLGVWPDEQLTPDGLASLRERVTAYMQKATKEAKIHTSWINANVEYDEAVRDFVARLLADTGSPFVTELLELRRRLAFFGYFNSLSQVLLKGTSPGVPDFYQGSELWDLSLVDPDNRRPVDFARRQALLRGLKDAVAESGGELTELCRELLLNLPDGRIKMYLTWQLLTFRAEHDRLFAEGDYLPLPASGPKREHVVAYRRSLNDEAVVAVTPRLVVGLTAGEELPPLGEEVWGDTRLSLPDEEASRRYRNVLTGEVLTVEDGGLPLAKVFAAFPVALLNRER